VLTVAVSSDRSLRELTEIAERTVKLRLERAAGVGEVRVVGGLERAINIWLDADRLAAYELPVSAVRDAIARQNSDVPGGNVTAGAHERVLRTLGRLSQPGDFGTGRIVGGSLEASNVDLGQEFINMIMASTGYTASSRVIKTTDDLLQQLLVLGR